MICDNSNVCSLGCVEAKLSDGKGASATRRRLLTQYLLTYLSQYIGVLYFNSVFYLYNYYVANSVPIKMLL